MNRIIFLDLPDPPEFLINEAIDLVNEVPVDPSKKEWFDSLNQNQVNSVTDVSGLRLPEHLQDCLNKLYSPYLKQSVIGIITKFQNLDPRSTAVVPPHCDRGRRIAINYMLQAGGTSVTTCFYKQRRKSSTLDRSENAPFLEVDLDYEIQFATKQWHSYDVQVYHGVKNIESSRIFLALLLDSNPTLEEFMSQNSEVVLVDQNTG